MGRQGTDAVVEFLESTRVGCKTAARVIGPREESQASGEEEEEGGPDPLRLYIFPFPLSLFPLPFLHFLLWRSGE